MCAESKARRSAVCTRYLGIAKALMVALVRVRVTAVPAAPPTAGGTSRPARELPLRLLGEFA